MNKCLQLSGWGAVLLTAAQLHAQRPCLPFANIIPPADSPYVTCEVTMEFVRPVDLDGDGVADFTHERFRSHHRFERPEKPELDLPYRLEDQDDTVEALFPAGHVEVYCISWWLRDDWGQHAEVRVPVGWELLPTPEVGKYWNFPLLQAEGLGIIARHAEVYPYEMKPGWVTMWAGSSYTGRLYQLSFGDPPPEGGIPRFDVYVGFRLRREDGWHLGWLRLKWEGVLGIPQATPVELASWAVHPEPEAARVVGGAGAAASAVRAGGGRGLGGAVVAGVGGGGAGARLQPGASGLAAGGRGAALGGAVVAWGSPGLLPPAGGVGGGG